MNHDETTNNTTTDLTTTDGRLPDGRFAPGNSIARGNPNQAKVQKLRSAIIDRLVDDDAKCLNGVVTALLRKALGGDVAAARLLLEYGIGKPTTPVSLESAGAPAVQFNIAQLTEIANADG